MSMNDIAAILGRLQRGVSKLSDSDIRLMLYDIYKKLEVLDAKTNCTPGCDQVVRAENSKPEAGKRGRPRKSDDAGPETGGDV